MRHVVIDFSAKSASWVVGLGSPVM